MTFREYYNNKMESLGSECGLGGTIMWCDLYALWAYLAHRISDQALTPGALVVVEVLDLYWEERGTRAFVEARRELKKLLRSCFK